MPSTSLRNLALLVALLVLPQIVSADALLAAFKARDFARAGQLVKSGAQVNVSFADGKTPLMIAGKRGLSALVEQLLNAGADVNATNINGGTALMFSTITGDLPTIHLLLQHGARINDLGANRWGALMVAAVKGHREVVSLFLQRGADPNLADVYGWSPLMRAASRNRTQSAQVLLMDKRTRLEHRDDDGATALHRAADEGHVAMLKLLVKYGADVAAVDASGRTAKMRAKLMRRKRAVQWLAAR